MIPEAVLQHFDIQPLSVRQLNSDKVSFVAEIRCDSYACILKGYRAERTAGDIEKQIRLRQLLRQHHFKYLPPTFRGAEELVMEHEGRAWTVGAFVASDDPFDWTRAAAWSEAHCDEAATVLADFHAVGQKILESSVTVKLPVVDTDYFLRVWDRSCSFGEAGRSGERDASVLTEFNSRLEMLEGRLKEALHVVRTSACSLPEVIIHGDFHPGNVLFDNQKAAVLLDFEYASVGSPLVDLAYACVMFFASDITSGINNESAKRFLDTYSAALDHREIGWTDWMKNPSCIGEFNARMTLSAFLMLFWAVEGIAAAKAIEKEEYEHGLRLALRLLAKPLVIF